MAVMAVMFLATGLLAQTPRPPEPLLSKLLRIAGLTAAPSQMRGPGDNAAAGDIWMASIDRRSARALTTDGGYRSPMFVNNAPVVLALRGNSVVRLGAQGGQRNPSPGRCAGIVKLVGMDSASPAEVVVLLDAPASDPWPCCRCRAEGCHRSADNRLVRRGSAVYSRRSARRTAAMVRRGSTRRRRPSPDCPGRLNGPTCSSRAAPGPRRMSAPVTA